MGGCLGKKTSEEEKPEENPSPPQEATPPTGSTVDSEGNPSGVVSSTGSTIESSRVRDE